MYVMVSLLHLVYVKSGVELHNITSNYKIAKMKPTGKASCTKRKKWNSKKNKPICTGCGTPLAERQDSPRRGASRWVINGQKVNTEHKLAPVDLVKLVHKHTIYAEDCFDNIKTVFSIGSHKSYRVYV